MQRDLVKKLQCPNCHQSSNLSLEAFEEMPLNPDVVDHGLLICRECGSWYPIECGVLEFLPQDMCYKKDREDFVKRYRSKLSHLGLDCSISIHASDADPRKHQQSHFDWYAKNDLQSYEEYEKSNFWQASDRLIIKNWSKAISNGRCLLDVGCAQGRSTFNFMELDLDIVAFDISKRMIEKAVQKYREGSPKARASFFVGDATTFPVESNVFDYVVLYGVLHHVPDPSQTCEEIYRVLKHGGCYMGHENNESIFRRIFDFLQKVSPQWHEEAGEEPLISKDMLSSWFPENASVKTTTSVFVPPHLINLLPWSLGYKVLHVSERVGQYLPWLRDQGGLIICEVKKGNAAEPAGGS